jgi:hypothetical protein
MTGWIQLEPDRIAVNFILPAATASQQSRMIKANFNKYFGPDFA